MTADFDDKLKKFHGENHTDSAWNSKNHACCSLCKTKNTTGKFKHWAKGLCRSCYRRLSATHRLYNDKWNQENSSTAELAKKSVKKNYKYTSPEDIEFSELDISTLLERYDLKCAYCEVELQDYDHKKIDAFQIEYKGTPEGFELIPACRGCNCSKKNLTEPDKLKRWAYDKGLKFPFEIKPAPKKP
jgi:hypothetical protein